MTEIKSNVCILVLIVCYLDSGHSQQCGRSDNSNRIVGGETATRLHWPWMALLKITFTGSGYTRASKCGGSLISDEWVMTAAHCVNSPANYRLSSVEITLGEHDVTRVEGTEIRTYGSEVFLNSFNPTTITNDIALIRLRQPLDLKGKQKYLQPICLPLNNLTTDGSRCFATGWGTTSSGGRAPNVLQQVRLPILDGSNCRTVYNSFRADYQLCAGYQQGGRDTCQGDSGGPLNCQLPNGAWIQEGITSFGNGCARPGTPGVYTKVSAHVKWIQKVTKINY